MEKNLKDKITIRKPTNQISVKAGEVEVHYGFQFVHIVNTKDKDPANHTHSLECEVSKEAVQSLIDAKLVIVI